MERLTKRIDGYAFGKVGRSIELAQKNKDYKRGCFECTGLIERLAELEDKLESGQLVELPKPFIGESENAYGETTYLVYRSKVETYCPSEDIFIDKTQAEARLKELQEKL